MNLLKLIFLAGDTIKLDSDTEANIFVRKFIILSSPYSGSYIKMLDGI